MPLTTLTAPPPTATGRGAAGAAPSALLPAPSAPAGVPAPRAGDAPSFPRSAPTGRPQRRSPEVVAREVQAQLVEAARYGQLPGQAGEAVPERLRASLGELVETAFPHLRAGTTDWRASVALAAVLAGDLLGRYAVPLAALPTTTTPGAREGVTALSRGIDALLDDAGVGVVLDLDAGTAAFRVRTPAGATPSCGRAALLATCVVLLHLRLTQPLALAALVTEGGSWLPVWRAARDLWTVSA
ncbi:hypothetical protein FHN55_19195 [Streptomyces sp. NP160]|uniref:hypothetical protein n=1 Tax=Streptomyces sp. NP160 TaxID=2586637 RepID=UPI001117B4F9|nr:hypothetical protein [Streptomyces sp. NP160]TNM59937.1 hypothetical protein FHN55_19195 [Streptomyces sp. NP160]